MKRYRAPKVKPGQLMAYYGRVDGDSPDVCFAWGAGLNKRFGNLLHYILGSKRIELAFSDEDRKKAAGRPYFFDKSALERLDEAGFDLRTLRFSIELKPVSASQPPPANENA